MPLKILRHRLVREVLGAMAGMGVATAAYVIFQQFSTIAMSPASLISTAVISDNAHQIRVNDKAVDENELKRIARHAREVAAALEAEEAIASASSSTSVPLTLHAASGLPVATDAVTQADRVQFRNDVAQAQRVGGMQAASPIAASSSASSVSSRSSSVSTVASSSAPSVDTGMVAEMPTSKSRRLPNSGIGLNTLVLLSVLFAFFSARPDIRRRLIAAVRGAH